MQSCCCSTMALNLEELKKNEFWLKKLRMEAKARDVDKDGFVSREDYRIVCQRYRGMGVSEERLKKLEKIHEFFYVGLGLVDDTVKLTYDQCIENLANCTAAQVEGMAKIFDGHFAIIDTNENGEISFDEWETYYKVLGIDTKYARASFDAMDTNGDGVISKEEFTAFNTEYFLSTDDKLRSSLMYGPLD